MLVSKGYNSLKTLVLQSQLGSLMPKKKEESYIDYRKRVMDPVSSSFCAAKWFNATIWLGSGATASCHHPPAHRIPIAEVRDNPKAIHNTVHKKLMRAQMLKGERPSECEYCWKIEDIQRDNVSDRIFKTVIYGEEDIEKIKHTDIKSDIAPKTLEVAFDRTCNFACSYCNASFSTTWAKDIKKNGAYQNLISDGAKAFQQNGDWAEPFSNEENPYVKAFWLWWPELSKSLDEIRVTGGEPLLSKDLWILIEKVKAENKRMRVAINSNLGSSDKHIDRLIDASKEIENLHLYTSCEAFGEQAEYIRDGLNFDKYCKNLEKCLGSGDFKEIHLMMTINSLCLFSITDFLDQVIKWKKKFGKHSPTISVNLLRFPSFMSPLALPEHLKSFCKENLQKWLAKHEEDPILMDFEKEGLKRLVDYLDIVKTPHKSTSSLKSQWQDFKSFFTQYDKRRGKSFSSTFPSILVDWFNSLSFEGRGHQGLVDGDATNVWRGNKELKKLAVREGLIYKEEK